MCRDIEPLQYLDDSQYQGMLSEEAVVVEPHDVVDVGVVAEVSW